MGDARVSLQDLDLVTSRGATPLRTADVGLVESEGITTAGGLPSQAVLRKPTLAVLLGEVQVYVVETLAARHGD